MFKVERFIVLPYVRRKGRLVKGEPRQFYTYEEAAPVAARLRRRHEVVEFYSVTGWPVQDLWDRPKKVASK